MIERRGKAGGGIYANTLHKNKQWKQYEINRKVQEENITRCIKILT
jgi:hypothetical protein